MEQSGVKLGSGVYLPPRVQQRRLRRAIERELTARQRQVLTGHWLEGMTVTQLARELGVQKSTVSRTLHRAENRLKRVLGY